MIDSLRMYLSNWTFIIAVCSALVLFRISFNEAQRRLRQWRAGREGSERVGGSYRIPQGIPAPPSAPARVPSLALPLRVAPPPDA